MASMGSLHLLRHMARRSHQDAIRRNAEDAELYATAHEEICELFGKVDLLLTLCHLCEDSPGNTAEMKWILVAGSIIGISHPLVLNFKACESGWPEPQSSCDDPPISKSD